MSRLLATTLVIILLFSYHNPSGAETYDEAFVLLLAARNAWKAGKLERALQRYRTLVEKYPVLTEGMAEYGWLLVELKRYVQALSVFREAVQKDPYNRDAVYGYLRMLLDRRGIREISKVIDDLVGRFPDDPGLRLLEAEFYFYTMRYGRATSIYTELLGSDVDHEARKGLVDLYTAVGNHSGASMLLEDIGQKFNSSILRRRIINLAHRHRIIEAYRELNGIEDPLLQKRIRAELLNITGGYFEAEGIFRDLLQEDPSDYGILTGLAESLSGQGDYDGASSVYRAILERYPEDVVARLRLTEVLIRGGNYRKAGTMLEEMVKEYPWNIYALYLSYLLKRKTGKALDHNYPLYLADNIRDMTWAKMVQDAMMRDGDYVSVMGFSEELLSRDTYRIQRDFIMDYLRALLYTGRNEKGLRVVEGLLQGMDDSLYARIFQAEFRRMMGKDGGVLEGFYGAGGSGDEYILLSQLYYRLGDFTRSALICTDRLSVDPDDVQAIICAIRGLSADENEDRLIGLMDTHLNGLTDETKKALLLLMGDVSDGREGYYRTINTLMERWGYTGGDEGGQVMEDRDLLFVRANALLREGRYTDAIQAYKALRRKIPLSPSPVLLLARAFAMDRQYERALSAYDEYLEMVPYNIGVWREKARLYGEMRQYKRALSEYMDILNDYPYSKETFLEMKAKESIWKGWYRDGGMYVEELLRMEPISSEALFDGGQINSRGGRFNDAGGLYRRLLLIQPGHTQARLALDTGSLAQSPHLKAGSGYVHMKGYDEKTLISYMPITIGGGLTLAGGLGAGVDYRHIYFDLHGDSTEGDGLGVGLVYAPNYYTNVDLYLSFLEYNDNRRFNIATSIVYEWFSGIEFKLALDRTDLWENRDTVLSGIYVDRYLLAIRAYRERLEMGLSWDYSRYSDNNRRINGEVFTAYMITPFPGILRVITKLRYYGFERGSVYFSPDSYSLWTLALEWRYFYGFPSKGVYLAEGEDRNSWFIYYAFSLDSDIEPFNEVRTGVYWSIRKGLNIRGYLGIVSADVYDEATINGTVEYYF